MIVNVASIMANFVYSRVCAKALNYNKTVILCSSVAIAILLPIAFIQKNTMAFLALYGICYFFITIINVAVPVAVTENTALAYNLSGIETDCSMVFKFNGHGMINYMNIIIES